MAEETPTGPGASTPVSLTPAAPNTSDDKVSSVLSMLREFMRAEPEACRKLFKAKITLAGTAFAGNTQISVASMRKAKEEDPDRFSVSPLGIINGVLAVMLNDSNAKICMMSNAENGEFIGFGIVDSNGAMIG